MSFSIGVKGRLGSLHESEMVAICAANFSARPVHFCRTVHNALLHTPPTKELGALKCLVLANAWLLEVTGAKIADQARDGTAQIIVRYYAAHRRSNHRAEADMTVHE